MRILRTDRLRKRPLTQRRRKPKMAIACPGGHPRNVATQKTQVRERLGAQIKRARRQRGMKKQNDLAAAIGMSVSVVSLVERGNKVEDKTLALVESALGFPVGTFDDFLAGHIDALPDLSGPEPEPEEGKEALDRLLSMTREEMLREAELYDEIEPGSGDEWLRRVLEIRRRAQTNTNEVQDRAAR